MPAAWRLWYVAGCSGPWCVACAPGVMGASPGDSEVRGVTTGPAGTQWWRFRHGVCMYCAVRLCWWCCSGGQVLRKLLLLLHQHAVCWRWGVLAFCADVMALCLQGCFSGRGALPPAALWCVCMEGSPEGPGSRAGSVAAKPPRLCSAGPASSTGCMERTKVCPPCVVCRHPAGYTSSAQAALHRSQAVRR
jgi:hypothetical protein